MKHMISAGMLLMMAMAAAAGAAKGPRSAKAELRDAQGKAVGTARLTQAKGGVRIALRVTGLSAGTHAFHIHTAGKCEAPDFKSAGGTLTQKGRSTG